MQYLVIASLKRAELLKDMVELLFENGAEVKSASKARINILH